MIALSLSGCKSNQVGPEDYNHSKIILGTGGGFTGHVSRYCLMDNGTLFSKMHLDTGYMLIDQIKTNTCEQLINNFTTLGLDQIGTNKPGNVYRFLEYYTDEKKHAIIWNPHNDPDQDILNNYYNTIMQLFTIKNK